MQCIVFRQCLYYSHSALLQAPYLCEEIYLRSKLAFETNCVVVGVYCDLNNNYLLFANRNIYCYELFKAIMSFNVIVNTICDIERYVANFALVCDQICDGRTCDLFRE